MPRGSTGSVDVVGVLACAEDRAVADQLAEYLEIAGLTVVAVDSEQVLPGLVVLISEAALADEAWQRLATEQRTARLVPVRLDPVPDERVPDRLAQRQRVDLDLADYVLTWSTVITVLRTDPASARIRFDLEVRARNWQQAGYPRDLLIRDGQTLGSYAAVLGDEDDSDAFDPEDPRVAYVIAADGNLRRRRNQRLITVAGTLAIIVAVFLIASEVFGAIQQAELTSRSVMVTTGSNLVNEAPEWAAMHAAAVTLRGTDQEREAARRTLITALALPWGPDVPNVSGGSVEAILPLERSGDPLYLIGRGDDATELVRYDAPRNEPHWSRPFDVRLWAITVDPTESTAFVGGDGLFAVDLDTQAVRLLSDQRVDHIVVLDDGRLIVAAWTGDLAVISPDGSDIDTVPSAGSLLAMRASQGGALALFRDEGRYVLRDARSGEVLSEADLGEPTLARGGVFPDQVGMVVVGDDQQLWTVLAGEEPRPTGIAVPERTFEVLGLSEGRVAFGGQSSRVRTVHLDSGADLGTVCRRDVGYRHFRPSVGDAAIACVGPVGTDISDIPLGPVAEYYGLTADMEVAVADGPNLALEGRVIVAQLGDRELRAQLTVGEATAIALAPEGDRILVGTDQGEVLIFAVEPRFGPGLVLTNTPDRAPVTRVGWQADGPVAETTADLRWRIPDCPGCGHEDGLLAHLADRLPRCWGEDQLADFDHSIRRDLDVDACW